MTGLMRIALAGVALWCAALSSSCAAESGDPPAPASTPGDAAVEATILPGDAGSTPSKEGIVYASTQTSLHSFEPYSKAFKKVGDFDCTVAPISGASQQGMADIAANAKGELFGVGMTDPKDLFWALVGIDPKTAHCTVIRQFPKVVEPPIGLTFLPKNVLGPDEVLVGIKLGGSYVRYDTSTGTESQIGTTAVSNCKASDIVSVEGGETYVAGCPGQNPHLYAINPANGSVVRDVSTLTTTELVGGVGFWGGTVYGFLSDGTLWSIDPKTGISAKLAVSGGAPFWGAAVTTTAPLALPN